MERNFCRIINAYIQGGRIANTTEQDNAKQERFANPTEQVMERNFCRIINAYIQSGRIANPTEQDVANPAEQTEQPRYELLRIIRRKRRESSMLQN